MKREKSADILDTSLDVIHMWECWGCSFCSNLWIPCWFIIMKSDHTNLKWHQFFRILVNWGFVQNFFGCLHLLIKWLFPDWERIYLKVRSSLDKGGAQTRNPPQEDHWSRQTTSHETALTNKHDITQVVVSSCFRDIPCGTERVFPRLQHLSSTQWFSVMLFLKVKTQQGWLNLIKRWACLIFISEHVRFRWLLKAGISGCYLHLKGFFYFAERGSTKTNKRKLGFSVEGLQVFGHSVGFFVFTMGRGVSLFLSVRLKLKPSSLALASPLPNLLHP